MAAREGNLRDLQSALDRRKFAVARDDISPNKCTPLHVAVIFGHAGNTSSYLYTQTKKSHTRFLGALVHF